MLQLHDCETDFLAVPLEFSRIILQMHLIRQFFFLFKISSKLIGRGGITKET